MFIFLSWDDWLLPLKAEGASLARVYSEGLAAQLREFVIQSAFRYTEEYEKV